MDRQDALNEQVYSGDVATLWKELTPLWESEGCKVPTPPPIGETIDCEVNGDKKWL